MPGQDESSDLSGGAEAKRRDASQETTRSWEKGVEEILSQSAERNQFY